jgi:hypothetical protein
MATDYSGWLFAAGGPDSLVSGGLTKRHQSRWMQVLDSFQKENKPIFFSTIFLS